MMVSKNKIDFTNISYVHVRANISSASAAGTSIMCMLDNDRTTFSSVWYQGLGATVGEMELIADFRTISGSYYLKWGVLADGQPSYFINGYINVVTFDLGGV